jgi:hypothetical protein
MSCSIPDSHDQNDMALGTISDFEMRKKVADLMAVAPALPVRGLYRLLVHLEGDLSAARKEAMRASRAPSIHPSIKPETPSEVGYAGSFSKLAHVVDDDELMVKIDPNDSFLEWESTQQIPEPCMMFANIACQRTGFRLATSARPKSAACRYKAPASCQVSPKAQCL